MFQLSKMKRKLKLTNLVLIYEGKHNKTYKGLFFHMPVQIRVAKNKIVNHKNEILFLKNHEDIIYIDNKVMVKKWIDGETLSSNDINTLFKLKDVLVSHWKTEILGISFFGNKTFNEKDIVLSHGDLRPKNIISSNNKQIVLIDFEWINYNTKYFDLAHLYLYCFFTLEDIIKVFGVDKEILKKEIELVNEFNIDWETKYK